MKARQGACFPFLEKEQYAKGDEDKGASAHYTHQHSNIRFISDSLEHKTTRNRADAMGESEGHVPWLSFRAFVRYFSGNLPCLALDQVSGR